MHARWTPNTHAHIVVSFNYLRDKNDAIDLPHYGGSKQKWLFDMLHGCGFSSISNTFALIVIDSFVFDCSIEC